MSNNTVVESAPQSKPAAPESTPAPSPRPSTGNGYQSPLSSLVVTSPFGPRVDPTGTAGTYHDGIDFALEV